MIEMGEKNVRYFISFFYCTFFLVLIVDKKTTTTSIIFSDSPARFFRNRVRQSFPSVLFPR